jgi:flagella basal body P-ring formation protein FlgA
MKGLIRIFVENPSSRGAASRRSGIAAVAAATLLVALLLSSASGAFATPAINHTDLEPAVAETAEAQLAKALQQWADQHLVSTSGVIPTYTFALKDKRLAIPACDRFVIDPKQLIPGQRAPASLAVDAACPATNWQRKIRGRLKKDPRGQSLPANQVPSVAVLRPVRPITKGQRVEKDALHTEWLPPHRAPQNAITQLDNADYYAARNLRVGQTLVTSDLAIAQKVIVIVQAIPARSRITPKMVAMRQRAVDVPKDAYRTFEGLEMLAANRLLHPGDILRKRDLTKAKLVKRGQRVSVESVGAYFRIASELVALQDGFLGDQIELRNPGSDRQVTAIVTGAGKARSL